MAEKTTEETVAEVQQMFNAEAKDGEPVAPEHKPSEAATPAESKDEEKAVTTEPKVAPLLAGKYKTPEEMVTAYKSLQAEHNTQTAKMAEQESALGVAAKDREAHQKFLDVVGKADPENVQTAILQYQKETGRIAFDGEVIDPKVAVHLAAQLNPALQKLEDRLVYLESGKNAEVEAEAKAEYEKTYPYMADKAVQGEVDKVVSELKANSPDGQINGDDLAAAVLKIGRDAGLREKAAEAALETRTGTEAAASAGRTSEPAPKQTKGEYLVEGIFGDSEKGIASTGEMPPDII